MAIEKFTVLSRLLTSKSDAYWHRPYDERKIKALDDALTLWEQAKEEGGIENARFVESKRTISRAIEDAWSSITKDRDYLLTLDPTHADALAGPHPNLSTIVGRIKRIQKVPESPLRTQLLDFLQDVLPIVEVHNFLKSNTKKKLPKSEEQIRDEKLALPAFTTQAVRRAQEILAQAISRPYQGLLERQKKLNRALIESYLSAQEKAIQEGKEFFTPNEFLSVKDAKGVSRVADPHGASFLASVLVRHTPSIGKLFYQPDENTYTRSDELALRATNDMRDQFIHKNTVKLIPILEGKGDALFDKIEEVGELDLSRLEGEFKVSFKDGSSFHMRNAVVFVTNQFGTHFCRFPTTFHDVILPGGEAMSYPSETRLNTVFIHGSDNPRTSKTPSP